MNANELIEREQKSLLQLFGSLTDYQQAHYLKGLLSGYGFTGEVECLGGNLYGVVCELPSELHAVLTSELIAIYSGELCETMLDSLQLDQMTNLSLSNRVKVASFMMATYVLNN